MEITVVNKHSHKPTQDDVYIGRGSALGNPFTHLPGATKAIHQVASREQAVESYKNYLIDLIDAGDPGVLKELEKIKTKARTGKVNLVCYCAPKACHGDVIRELIGKAIRYEINREVKVSPPHEYTQGQGQEHDQAEKRTGIKM